MKMEIIVYFLSPASDGNGKIRHTFISHLTELQNTSMNAAGNHGNYLSRRPLRLHITVTDALA